MDHVGGQNAVTNIDATSEVEIDLSAQEIDFGTPNAVMFQRPVTEDERNPASPVLDEKHLPVITDKGWAYNSRFELSDETALQSNGSSDGTYYQLGLSTKLVGGSAESNAAKSVNLTWADITNLNKTAYSEVLNSSSTNGVPATNEFSLKRKSGNTTVVRNWWEAINQDLMFENGTAWMSFARGETSRDASIKQVLGGCEGFDYGSVEWYPDWQDPNGGYYSYKIANENAVKLYLPSHSGTLATEKYVNVGFEVTKKFITDGIEYVKQLTTSGHEEWLQTVVVYTDPVSGKTTRVIHDSYVKAIGSGVSPDDTTVDQKNAKLVLELNTRKKPYGDAESASHANLTTVEKLVKANRHDSESCVGTAPILGKFAEGTDAADGADGFDYHIGAGTALTLNPSVREKDKVVENFLPNHSGMLLNNNSVIDCGYWPAPSSNN